MCPSSEAYNSLDPISPIAAPSKGGKRNGTGSLKNETTSIKKMIHLQRTPRQKQSSVRKSIGNLRLESPFEVVESIPLTPEKAEGGIPRYPLRKPVASKVF